MRTIMQMMIAVSLASCGNNPALDPSYLAKMMIWAKKTCACKKVAPGQAKACLAAAAFDIHQTPTKQVYGDYALSLSKKDQELLYDLEETQRACKDEIMSKIK